MVYTEITVGIIRNTNALCGKYFVFSVKPSGTYSNHQALKG
jgi:hypothetical protein